MKKRILSVVLAVVMVVFLGPGVGRKYKTRVIKTVHQCLYA